MFGPAIVVQASAGAQARGGAQARAGAQACAGARARLHAALLQGHSTEHLFTLAFHLGVVPRELSVLMCRSLFNQVRFLSVSRGARFA